MYIEGREIYFVVFVRVVRSVGVVGWIVVFVGGIIVVIYFRRWKCIWIMCCGW